MSDGAFVVVAVMIAAAAVGVDLWLIRVALRARAGERVSRAALAVQRRAEPVFRRPAEWGSLTVPRGEVERLRIAILVDQLTAGPDLVTVYLADGHCVGLTPYEPAEVQGGETDDREAAQYWLAHWQDDIRVLTGVWRAA